MYKESTFYDIFIFIATIKPVFRDISHMILVLPIYASFV